MNEEIADGWREMRRRFRADDVARAEWLVERPESPIDRIVKDLAWSPTSERSLLCGSRGTGKSTELRRAFQAFIARQRRVLYFDLYRTLENEGSQGRLTDLEPWEIAILVAGAALGALRAISHPAEPELTTRLAAATKGLLAGDDKARGEQTRSLVAGFAQLVAAGASAAVLFSGAAAPLAGPAGAATSGLLGGLFAAVKLGSGNAKRADDDTVVQALGEAVNAIVRELGTVAGPVILLLDGLDRATEDSAGKAAADRWFGSSLLAQLGTALVATAPWWVLHGKTPGWGMHSLCEVPVLDRHHLPSPNADAIRFFTDVYRRRTADLPLALVPPALVEELAFVSGGIARDFLKLIGGPLAAECGPDGVVADAEAVRRVVKEWRITEVEAGLSSNDIDILKGVRDDPTLRPPSGEDATRLIVTRRLLPYRNDSEWFYPHPALLRGPLLGEPGSTR
jgi:hypothetical protein